MIYGIVTLGFEASYTGNNPNIAGGILAGKAVLIPRKVGVKATQGKSESSHRVPD